MKFVEKPLMKIGFASFCPNPSSNIEAFSSFLQVPVPKQKQFNDTSVSIHEVSSYDISSPNLSISPPPPSSSSTLGRRRSAAKSGVLDEESELKRRKRLDRKAELARMSRKNNQEYMAALNYKINALRAALSVYEDVNTLYNVTC